MRTFTKFFLSLLLLSGLVIAQSNHTITIDGTNDFTTSVEQFSTTSGTDLYAYITWDASNIYFGFSGNSPAGTVTDNNRVYHIYIDTDPTGTNGTTDGEMWRWDPTLPFNADYHYAFKTIDNSEYKRSYSGGSWADATIGTSNWKGSGFWELSISRSDIGNPTSVKVLMYVEEDWDGGSICGGLPSDLFTNTSTQGAITFNSHYQGFTLDEGYDPNNDNSHDYVMRKNYAYLSFDGNDDYVKYSNDATLELLDGATDYTIEAWIYPNSSTVVEYDRVLQRYYSFAIVMYDGNDDGNVEDWYFQVIDDSGNNHYFNTEGDATLTLDAWNHIAVINSSTDGSLKLYVNGTDVTTVGGYSNQSLRASVSNDNLYIGSKKASTPNNSFGGDIDEVRLLNKAVDPSELHYQKTDNAYMTDANTAGLFHFDEGSGTNTENISSGTDATLNNGVQWVTDVSGLPLPVELTSFTANVSGSTVNLIWETATEINNYGFEIERATKNYDWQKIGFVEGAGNSNSPKEYTFTDNIGKSGNYSYRLKQIDINGEYKYSDVIEVSVGLPTKFELKQNYPNPFNPTTNIKYSIAKKSRVMLRVFDMLGREVATLVNKEQAPGNYVVEFDASRLSSGVYFYALKAGEFTATKKMILMK